MEVSSDKVGSLFRWVLRMGTAKGACVLADLDIMKSVQGNTFFSVLNTKFVDYISVFPIPSFGRVILKG